MTQNGALGRSRKREDTGYLYYVFKGTYKEGALLEVILLFSVLPKAVLQRYFYILALYCKPCFK